MMMMMMMMMMKLYEAGFCLLFSSLLWRLWAAFLQIFLISAKDKSMKSDYWAECLMLPSILMYAHPSSSCLPHQQYHLHKVTVTTVIRVFHLRHHHHYHLHKHDAYLMFPRMLMWVSLKLANPAPHSLVLARMEAWSKLASAIFSSPPSPS